MNVITQTKYHQTILRNLEGRAHALNRGMVMMGVDDSVVGSKALQELIQQSIVIVEHKKFRHLSVPHYRLNPYRTKRPTLQVVK